MENYNDIAYILNTFLLLFSGCLVMLMAAGFAMLESGLVRSKNTTAILTKNIGLYALACIGFYMVGYQLMYGDFTGENHSGMADFFFQVVFVATAASIVSGTIAERAKFWPFMGVVLVLTAIIYPAQGAWTWGGGWLSDIGFSDFAGSTIVHSVGGWCALAGAMLLGPRAGRYNKNGKPNMMAPANLPLATLGTFILWFGWFGFNGGSQLAMSTKADVDAIATVIANTNIAACAGALMAMIMTYIFYKRIDLTMVLNGALAGLVSITAGPDYPTMWLACVIGMIGGAFCVYAVPLWDKLKIDDPVGALSVHLVAGIWGTLAVGIFKPDVAFMSQLIGVASIGGFVLVCSLITWAALKYSVGIRVSKEIENAGLDTECGTPAYSLSKTSAVWKGEVIGARGKLTAVSLIP
jgi:Amt family ammonium transporter|tara:strand:+ start:1446 stop:2672 length:1227 start_codon:yes stop_codon:yes gene_type:complete